MNKQFGVSKEQAQANKVKKILEIIAQHGEINRFILCQKAGLTVRDYYLIAPYIKEVHQGIVQYDKDSKNWVYVGPKLEEEQRIEEV